MEKSDGLPRRSDGQSCPPLQKLHGSILPNDGTGEMVQVFKDWPKKLSAIERILEEDDAPCGGPVLPDGHQFGGVLEAARKKVRLGLAGMLLLVAAGTAAIGSVAMLGHYCHPHHGSNHGVHHATHSPKGNRRRPHNGTNEADGDGKLDDGGAAAGGDGPDCIHAQRVDWCEYRIDDCFCWQRQRRCRWDGGGLSATVTSGIQDLKREAVLLAEGHRAQPIKSESENWKAENPCRMGQNRGMMTVEHQPRYSLRKGLGCWELVFAGRKATLNDGRGVHIVAYLLRNPPPERLHAVDLEKLVWAQGFVGEKAAHLATESAAELEECHLTVRSEPGGLTRSADDNELLKREVRELLAIVRDDTLPAAEREEAQDKLDELSRAMSGSKGISRDAAQAVERVRKAILRLHEQLACAKDERQEPHEVLLAFGEHVRKYLIVPSARFTRSKTSRNQAGVAGTFTYEPPPGVKWS